MITSFLYFLVEPSHESNNSLIMLCINLSCISLYVTSCLHILHLLCCMQCLYKQLYVCIFIIHFYIQIGNYLLKNECLFSVR